MTTPEAEVRFKDFSKQRIRVVFRLDDEDFDAMPILPVPVMQRLIGQANALQDKGATAETLTEVIGIFDTVLLPESAARFVARINSVDKPVDLGQVMDIMTWLMELYGKRPTQPSSDSSDGSPTETVGMISTAGVSVGG